MIQEFYISVTPVGEEEYLVRTERVAPGVPLAEEQFTWRIEDWILETQQLMDDPLLSVLQGNANPGSVTRQGQDATRQWQPNSAIPNLTVLGQQLYNALFQATIRDSWMTAQGIAYHRREALRLRLGLKGPRLPRLPWEVLHAGNRPIATGTDLVFSRYQPTFTPIALPLSLENRHNREVYPESAVLKILMVISAPTDQASLELKQEVQQLQAELAKPANGSGNGKAGLPRIELTLLDQPDREHLTQALEQGHYQVLHYAGHSNLAAAGGNLYLVNRKTGLSETLSGDDLAGLLVNNGIQMAVFNSCRGAYALTTEPGDDTRERSLAEALVKRGIPAVLAMAERIPDDVALTLTRLLYRNLKQGYPVDLSLSRARQGLVSAYGSQQLYWALPILYLHPEFDGYLMPGEVESNPEQGVSSLPILAKQSNSQAEPGYVNGSPLINQLTSGQPWGTPPGANSNGNGAGHYSNGSQTKLDPPVPPLGANLELPAEPPVTDDILLLAESTELSDLIDDLEYHENLGSPANSSDVSDLIRQLSYSNLEEDIPSEEIDEAIVFAPQAESLIPQPVETQPSGYLELPENPLYRTVPVVVVPANAVALIPFISYHWQPRAFTRVRCVPFTEWKTVLIERLGLQSYFGLMPVPASRPAKANLSPGGESPARPHPAPGQSRAANSSSNRASAEPLAPLLAVLTGATVTGLVLAGSWFAWTWFAGRGVKLPTIAPPSFSSKPGPTKAVNPEVQAKNVALADQAIAAFKQNNLSTGQQAVQELLDRNALDEANRALQVVDAASTDARMSFLRGRLAFQGVKAGRSQNSLGEAQRLFQTAAERADSPQLYHNALAFTYYASGKFDLVHPRFARGCQREAGRLRPDELTACAGLALAFMRNAQGLSPNSQAQLRQQAMELRDRVVQQAAKDFQPEALSQNWMWPEQAVQDWRSLLDLKP